MSVAAILFASALSTPASAAPPYAAPAPSPARRRPRPAVPAVPAVAPTARSAASSAASRARRSPWSVAAVVVLALFGAALVIASRRAADYVGPAALAAGVAEIAIAALLLLRVRHAGTAAVLAATSGLAFTGIALLAALTGRDPFVALGGSGGDAGNAVAAVVLVGIGHLVILAGGRRAP